MNAPLSPPRKTAAVFDFDHTLIEGDSFWSYLDIVVGPPRVAAALVEALALCVLRRAKDKKDPSLVDKRTFIKAQLLSRLLAGQPVVKLSMAAEKLRGRIKWKESLKRALLDHHAEGHHIVIASGGLDLYLPELLADLPHDGLLCTQVGVKEGIVTGEMIDGNCVRQRKAELVAGYIKQHGPFDETWGYGNLPHDLPMLQLLKHQVVV